MEITLSKKGIDLIVAAEVSSPAYYNKFLQGVTWPGGDSGCTFGVGYDLGQVNKEKFTADWGNDITPKELGILSRALGLKGTHAQDILKKDAELRSVKINYQTAYNVFCQDSLPKYLKSTLHIYPGLDQLKPDAIGGLLSMVYNRGASIDGPSRTEMASIVPMVAHQNYSGIAQLVDHSKRLWVGKPGMAGLIKRREAEAALIKGADHEYDDKDLIIVTI